VVITQDADWISVGYGANSDCQDLVIRVDLCGVGVSKGGSWIWVEHDLEHIYMRQARCDESYY
jgi:hypothetical protein